MIGIPTIDAQSAAIAERWPGFRARRLDDRTAIWVGELRPLLQTYQVEIAYRVPLIVERIDPLRQQPNVRVLTPRLKPRNGDPEGALPHVYWDDPQKPALCLFDAEANEWTPFESIAETTIPWTLDWLACYEGWRATGAWKGGGRHASAESQETSR